MNIALLMPPIIIGTYGTPPALWFGWRYLTRRRAEHRAAAAAELIAIDAWLDRIRSA